MPWTIWPTVSWPACGARRPLYYKGIGTFSTVRTSPGQTHAGPRHGHLLHVGYRPEGRRLDGPRPGQGRAGDRALDSCRAATRSTMSTTSTTPWWNIRPTGKTWTPLTRRVEAAVHVIDWQGEAGAGPVHVRLKRLESARTNYAAIRSFEVNPPRHRALGLRPEGRRRGSRLSTCSTASWPRAIAIEGTHHLRGEARSGGLCVC